MHHRLTRIAGIVALACVLLAAPAAAFEPGDNDAFYLGFGSANIELKDSDELLSGGNAFGGVRLGLFWTVFFELGYGAVDYSDTVVDPGINGGQPVSIDFRTTGAHYGLGLLVPIRNTRLGVKAQRSPNNRWAEEIKDADSGLTLSNVSGDIDFDSYYVFAQFGETGIFELGVRRDRIRSTDSVLDNSFGPYLAFNIPLN